MQYQKPKILIVDNEIEICRLFKDFFDFIGYDSEYETDGEKAIDRLPSLEYDLLFVDLKLDTISGLEVLKKSKVTHPLSEVIVVTGFGSEETVLRTYQYGASSFIQKPISFSDIRIQTEEALARNRFNRKTALLRENLADDDALHRHLETLIKLDRLSVFLNLTIDIEMLADSILRGMADMVAGDYYSFFFFDKIKNEIVIYSQKPLSRNVCRYVEKEIIERFERLTNSEIGEAYKVRMSLASTTTEESRDLSGFSSLYIPMMIENSIRGPIGVSLEQNTLSDEAKDVLHLVANRVSHVLTNATLHRDTKLLALTDGLTGLLNHRAFYDRLKQEFERYRRYGSNLSIIIADSDDLKKYNDTFGHPVGDEILRKIGEILRETSRETDVLARYGGDEFVILLPQTNAENTMNMAQRMKMKIENHEFSIQGKHFTTSISMGISTVPQEYIETPQALFESADRALYQAKRAGKNRIVVASETT